MPSIVSHHFHFPHFDFQFDNTHNLRLLYGIRAVREITSKLIFFFLPLFLYQLGPSLEILRGFGLNDFQKGMISVASFFIIFRVGMLLTVLPIGKMVVRFLGLRSAFIISRTLAIIVFLLLKESSSIHWFIFLAAFLDGVDGAFFWPLFHSLFGMNSTKKRVGEDLGLLAFIQQFVAMAAPAVGGVIAIVMGFEALFFIGLVISFIGVVLAVGLENESLHVEPKLKQFLRWLSESRYRIQAVSYVGRYINDTALSIWPLYVFLLLGSVDKVGYLYSFSLFLAMMLSFFIGFYIDHSKGKRPFLLSGGFISFIWLLRTQVIDVWSIAIVDSVDKLLASFHWLFYDSVLVKRGRGRAAYPFFIYREIILSIGSFFTWTIFLAIFLFWGDWRALFIVAAVGSLLSLFMSEKPRLSE